MTKDELKPIDTSKYKITETGQVLKMTKDEMKDKISMALKDSILQMGFEVICIKLSRLEKENAELKEQIEKMKCCENCRHYSHTYEHCYSYSSYQNCKSLSNWRLAEC